MHHLAACMDGVGTVLHNAKLGLRVGPVKSAQKMPLRPLIRIGLSFGEWT